MSFLESLVILSLTFISHAQSSNPLPPDSSFPQIELTSDNNACFKQGFYDCSVCKCNYSQSYFNIAVISISFFSILCGVFFLLSYSFVKKLRQKPGEILLVLAIVIILLGGKSIIEHFGLLNTGENFEASNVNECQGLGFLHMAVINIIHLYPITFYIYQAMTLKNPISASRISRKHYHSTTLSIAGILTAMEFGAKGIGQTIFGTCSMRTTTMIYFPILVYGSLFTFFLSIGFLIQKYLTQREHDLNRNEINFVKHYLKYLLPLCLLILGVCLVQFNMAFRVSTNPDASELERQKDSLNGLEICTFLFSNITPFLLMVARIRDPSVLKAFKRTFRHILCCECLQPQPEIKDTETLLLMDENGEVEKPKPTTEQEDQTKESKSMVEQKPCHPGRAKRKSTSNHSTLQRAKDPQMFYSIFAGIHYLWYLQKKAKENSPPSESASTGVPKKKKEASKEDVKEKKKFALHGAILKQNLPQIYREIKNKNYQVRLGIFTAYAPNLFNEFIEMDDITTELKNSLELMRNFSNIINASTTPNKQFQFITYNNKFILRSISKGQRRILLKILPSYLKHLKTKPFSLLARIYGVFRFEVMSPYRQVNWIIMKNVSESSGQCVERIYQLKGTNLNKESVVQEPDVNSTLLKGSELLRDEDFDRTEQGIYIDPNITKTFMEALQQDLIFLRKENLLNYSLMVTLVNKSNPYALQNRLSSSVILEVEESLEDKSMMVSMANQREEKQALAISLVQLQNPFCNIRSTRTNLYYSLEIDDFLTYYDWKRRWKTLFSKCSRSGGSFRSPKVYSQRFYKYMKKIGKESDDYFSIINRNDQLDYISESNAESSNFDDKESVRGISFV